MTPTADRTKPARRSRIEAIDLARGVALIAMAIYHVTWDLEFFGYADPGMTAVGGWKLFARCIASSFLFLVGVSLFLAHRDGIRWRGFGKRFAMVAGAAAVISAATFFATPDAFIFFGILHEIALASLLGLLFLRLPAPLTLAVSALVIAAPWFARAEIFNHPWLWWLGLAVTNPRSNDYVPLFPWLGVVLIGIASAKLAAGTVVEARLAALPARRFARPLRFIGRHSLAFYLIHQPVLISLVWLAAQVLPPAPISTKTRFSLACERSCGESRDSAFCARYCGCMFGTLGEQNMLEGLLAGKQSEANRLRVEDIAAMCTADTDEALMPEQPE